MHFPENLQYAPSHEWVETLPDGHVRVGISAYAQEQLGELVFVTLPEIGESIAAGERLADVESVKAVSDIYSPVSGTVVAVNEALLEEPGLLNTAPYQTWMVELSDVSEGEPLLDAAAYAAGVQA